MAEDHYNKVTEFFKDAAITKKGYYDADGKAQKHSIWQKMMRKNMQSLLAKIIKNGEINSLLDCGCGMGDVLAEIDASHKIQKLCGCDITKEMIDLAKMNYPAIDFKIANIKDLPYADRDFNIIMAVNVLHHLPKQDIDKAISELTRVANKYVIIEIKNKADLYSKYIKPRLMSKQFKDTSIFFTHFSVEDITKLFQNKGFSLFGCKPLFLFDKLSPIVVLAFKRS